MRKNTKRMEQTAQEDTVDMTLTNNNTTNGQESWTEEDLFILKNIYIGAVVVAVAFVLLGIVIMAANGWHVYTCSDKTRDQVGIWYILLTLPIILEVVLTCVWIIRLAHLARPDKIGINDNHWISAKVLANVAIASMCLWLLPILLHGGKLVPDQCHSFAIAFMRAILILIAILAGLVFIGMTSYLIATLLVKPLLARKFGNRE
jgi:hypothetical protein